MTRGSIERSCRVEMWDRCYLMLARRWVGVVNGEVLKDLCVQDGGCGTESEKIVNCRNFDLQE